MNYIEICVLLLLIIPAIFADTDYCQTHLCATGKKHIACGNNGNFDRICRKPQTIIITHYYRSLIVATHNLLRNKIAKGFKNFPPAERMATMTWDKELATLAELNVKQCEMRHDQCRNTPRYLFAGQNIASAVWREMNLTVSEVIKDQLHAWFRQHEDCPLHVINSYKKPLHAARYSHFTAMLQDNSNRIGCAILRSYSHGLREQIMTCNYAHDNILGAPVYRSGPTTSNCTTGTNRALRSLCSVREEYNFKKI